MRLKIWGVRGSLPTPLDPNTIQKRIESTLHDFIKSGYSSKEDVKKYFNKLTTYPVGGYGGNTICVELNTEKSKLIIDAGSGIKNLGYELMNGPCREGSGEIHIFLTHFHLDHLIGLPFFPPIFVRGNKIRFYAVQKEMESIIKGLFKKPIFPVSFEDLASTISFHTLTPRKEHRVGDMTLIPYQLDHPDDCWGFRIEGDNKSYAHCLDTEAVRTTTHELGQDVNLYQNADLMLFDSQYTIMETIEKVNWGHASATIGLDLAMRGGIEKVVFLHFDPAASDEKIYQTELQTRSYYETLLKGDGKGPIQKIDWCFATEGMEITL